MYLRFSVVCVFILAVFVNVCFGEYYSATAKSSADEASHPSYFSFVPRNPFIEYDSKAKGLTTPEACWPHSNWNDYRDISHFLKGLNTTASAESPRPRDVEITANAMKDLTDSAWYPSYYSIFPKKPLIEAAIAESLLGEGAEINPSTEATNQPFRFESQDLCLTGKAAIEGSGSGKATYQYVNDPQKSANGEPVKKATYDMTVPVTFRFEKCEVPLGEILDGKASGHIDVNWEVRGDPWFTGKFSLRNLSGKISVQSARSSENTTLTLQQLSATFVSQNRQIAGSNREIGAAMLKEMTCSGKIEQESRSGSKNFSCNLFLNSSTQGRQSL